MPASANSADSTDSAKTQAALTPQEKALPPPSPHERLLYAMLAMLARLPLCFWRALGAAVGWSVYWVLPRRRVALINVGMCFPEMTPPQRKALVRRHFISFTQAALDRIWLWHGSAAMLRRRLKIAGDVHAFEGNAPTIMFAPHFVGLDAGGMASGQMPWREFISIYTPQRHAASDTWARRGRTRFPNTKVVWRRDGIKPIAQSLRQGGVLYLLPDMNFGPQESVFVDFFKQPAATVPSLSRFARIGKAKVVSTITLIEPHGYTVYVQGPWSNFPTDDVMADTQRMNHELEGWIRQRPHEYFWLHKRFKTRPEGQASVY